MVDFLLLWPPDDDDDNDDDVEVHLNVGVCLNLNRCVYELTSSANLRRFNYMCVSCLELTKSSAYFFWGGNKNPYEYLN